MRAGKMLQEIFLVMSAAGKILSVQSLKAIDSLRKEFSLLMDIPALLMATQAPAIHVAMTSIWFEQFFAMASILEFAPLWWVI